MRISVVIPARNEEDVIERCVRSVLNQKVKPYEVIVVNDGSTDRTREIVERIMKKEKRVKLINFDKGHSAAFARNRGAEAARGDVVFFLDADQELLRKDFFRIMSEDFDGVDGVICPFVPPKPKNLLERAQMANYYTSHLPHNVHLVNGSSKYKYVIHSMRRKLFLELGGFDEDIFYFEDADLEDRFYKAGKAARYDWRLVLVNKYPETFSEFVRQSRWMGRGVYTMLRKGKFLLRAVAFWLVYIVSLILSFLNPLFFYLFILMNFIVIARGVKIWMKSKDLLGSLIFSYLHGVRSIIAFVQLVWCLALGMIE
ncbi:MAG: glycosyltransferase [Candidatus Micrarchaeia archaeon]